MFSQFISVGLIWDISLGNRLEKMNVMLKLALLQGKSYHMSHTGGTLR